MTDSPLANLSTIRGNFADLVKEHNLKVDQFFVVPAPDGEGPHHCMVIMHLDEGTEADSMDLKFSEIVKQEQDIERKEHREETHFNSFTDDLDEIDRDLGTGGLL